MDNINISPTELNSTDKDHPVPEYILDLLKSDRYKAYIDKFEETVQYIDSERNPTGINKVCREYALSNGHLNFKTIQAKNAVSGKIEDRNIIDPVNPYTPNDSEEYRLIVIDNASNVSTEQGLNKRESIEKLSKYLITLRDQLNYTIVLIQHQAQDKEGNDSFKLNRIKPSSDGLADAKTTTRDANMVIGLYSPFKYGLTEYEGYDITKFRNHIRFMEVIEDRDYGANGNICPLYFDGAVSFFSELPKADNSVSIGKVYRFMENTKKKRDSIFMMMLGKITNLFNKND